MALLFLSSFVLALLSPAPPSEARQMGTRRMAKEMSHVPYQQMAGNMRIRFSESADPPMCLTVFEADPTSLTTTSEFVGIKPCQFASNFALTYSDVQPGAAMVKDVVGGRCLRANAASVELGTCKEGDLPCIWKYDSGAYRMSPLSSPELCLTRGVPLALEKCDGINGAQTVHIDFLP